MRFMSAAVMALALANAAAPVQAEEAWPATAGHDREVVKRPACLSIEPKLWLTGT